MSNLPQAKTALKCPDIWYNLWYKSSVKISESNYRRLDPLTNLMQYPLIKSQQKKQSVFGFSKWVRYILAKLMLQEAL